MSTLPHNSSASPSSALPVTFPSEPTRKRWTREEYYRLGEDGWFQDQRVELIDGEIVVMSPQSHEHYVALERIRRCLEQAFGDGYWIRTQGPVVKGDYSEPEPDVCVVRGSIEAHTDHPASAELVVEVSKTSLRFDTTTKQSLYASMNVPDYWVLDLENRQLVVYRQPIADEQTTFGSRYEQIETIAAEGSVSPLAKPKAVLPIGEMLPPVKQG